MLHAQCPYQSEPAYLYHGHVYRVSDLLRGVCLYSTAPLGLCTDGCVAEVIACAWLQLAIVFACILNALMCG